MKILLVPKTDNAQRTQLSPYFADTMHKLFKNCIKQADQDPQRFHTNMAL